MKNKIFQKLFGCAAFVLLVSCSSARKPAVNYTYPCQELMKGRGDEYIDMRVRSVILNFVENFRTAYNQKDIDLLAKVYSDDALIITGKVVKQTKSVENVMEDAGIFKEKIEYQTSTKKKYINYLHSIFKKNEKINVTFDKIQVVHSAECPDIYGVRLLQGWNTSNYSDTGFLFLMIDFRDGENMQVVVRTWQSGKEDGEALSEDEIFKLGDFDIKK